MFEIYSLDYWECEDIVSELQLKFIACSRRQWEPRHKPDLVLLVEPVMLNKFKAYFLCSVFFLPYLDGLST